MLAQDSLLGGRYRLTGRIAVGGMGEVWRAEDTVLHRTVAVKVLKNELTADPTFLERFRTEARMTAALSHPGIANVFDYGEVVVGGPGGVAAAYLVMEHVDGEPLSALLRRSGRLPVAQTLDVVRQAAAALDVAHRIGMVHRDVKPGNLLVRPDGVVKVTDFGIARAADAVPLTRSGMVVGTAQYFSPEQAEGRSVTAASDVYSLGVVAYECLAGRLPFVADSAVAVAVMQIREAPPPLPADVPPAVRALVGRAMAKDPRARFGTGGQFASAAGAVRDRPYDDPTTVLAVPPPAGVGMAGTQVMAPVVVPPRGPGPAGPAGPGAGPAGPGAGPPGPGPVGPVRADRRAPRWPVWVAVAVVLLLVGVGVTTQLLTRPSTGTGTGTGGPGQSAGPTTGQTGQNQTGGQGQTTPPSPTPTAPAPTSASPTVLTLDPADFVGRDADQVANELRDLGFAVRVVDAPAGTPGDRGTVVGLEPTGPVGVGSTITVVAIPKKNRGK